MKSTSNGWIADEQGVKQKHLHGISSIKNSNMVITQEQQDMFTFLERLFH